MGTALVSACIREYLQKKFALQKPQQKRSKPEPMPVLKKAQAVQQKLEAIISEYWDWSEFEARVEWNKADGYQLIVQPERAPARAVRTARCEEQFLRCSMLYLASLKPDGLKKISCHVTPLAENNWAGRAEHGIERLYLEEWNNEEYLLWYVSQEFDTQTAPKLIGETFDFRIITSSMRKDYSTEEFLESSKLK